MSIPAWPFITGSGRRLQVEGLSGVPKLPVEHTPAGTGPTLSRQTDDILLTTWTGSVVLSTAEVATFKSFLANTIGYGSIAFSWYDPISGAEAVYKLLSWSDVSYHSANNWRLSIMIEEQPGD